MNKVGTTHTLLGNTHRMIKRYGVERWSEKKNKQQWTRRRKVWKWWKSAWFLPLHQALIFVYTLKKKYYIVFLMGIKLEIWTIDCSQIHTHTPGNGIHTEFDFDNAHQQHRKKGTVWEEKYEDGEGCQEYLVKTDLHMILSIRHKFSCACFYYCCFCCAMNDESRYI